MAGTRPAVSTTIRIGGTRVGEARVAHGQGGVVSDHRARAHDDGVGPGPEPLDVGTGASPVTHREEPSDAAVLPSRLDAIFSVT